MTLCRTPPASPCIRLCQLDPATGWCIGCGRTGAEIGAWTAMNATQKQALLGELPARLALLNASGMPAAKRPD